MEGPHGGGSTPETTIAWLWGFLWGAGMACAALVVLWLVKG